MKLTEPQPRWIHESVFAFLCPHCQGVWLTCTKAPMPSEQQWELHGEVFGNDERRAVVPCKPTLGWKITDKEFETMSVTPSLDASAAGHWHGHITKGNIVGGI